MEPTSNSRVIEPKPEDTRAGGTDDDRSEDEPERPTEKEAPVPRGGT
jgi:hypothetical protein